QVGFVDPYQRLPGFDLLTDIHEPFDDLTGDAKTEIAFHSRANGPGETAFGLPDPTGGHEADNRRLLSRIAYCGGFLSGNGESNECDYACRDQNTGQNRKTPHLHVRLPNLDFIRTL